MKGREREKEKKKKKVDDDNFLKKFSKKVTSYGEYFFFKQIFELFQF